MVRITNTLTGQKEELAPPGDLVGMYVCGMTPKFHPHVGHARIFVAADVLRRYLEYRGYRVRHVQNFTDIDDKIIARAIEEQRRPEEVAKEYSDSYFEAMDALNVLRAHEYPTVTRVMPQIIAFVQALVESGHAYVGESEPGSTGGRDVWFAVDTYPKYGELSGREGALDEQQAGVRVELEPGKRDPRDFALWKSAKPGEPAWDSPWGPGRPGWHIECSAMVRETLGDTIDIHGGGRDLIFPHHENERAQSEALLGKLFVRHWAHAGLVETAGGEKMSHSLLNFRTVHDVLEAYDPMALRLYLLQTHYRSPLTFREEALAGAGRGLRRLRVALEPRADVDPSRDDSIAWLARQNFESAMDDDFNTSGALAALFELATALNQHLRRQPNTPEVAAEQQTLLELAGVLGLDLTISAPATADAANAVTIRDASVRLLLITETSLRETNQDSLAALIRDGLEQHGVRISQDEGERVWAPPANPSPDPFIDLLLRVRQGLRAARRWQLADHIRTKLKESGVVVEDQPGGSTWHFEKPPNRSLRDGEPIDAGQGLPGRYSPS
jgi:cysteinyl-tRNA synthetase